jgi:hypothetical protein
MPWSLSNEQRVGIVNRLRNNKKYALSISFPDTDIDASNYARELAEVFGAGGCEVSGPLPAARSPAVGILVKVYDSSKTHPGARLLMDVLAAAGINVSGTQATDKVREYSCLVVEERAS